MVPLPGDIYLLRTFWDNRSPSELASSFKRNLPLALTLTMTGYCDRWHGAKPEDLPQIWRKTNPPPEGGNRYVGICIIPEKKHELLSEIRGSSGLTGIPEMDKHSPIRPLTEVKDNPVIIHEFPAEHLADQTLVLCDGEKREIVFIGAGIDKDVVGKLQLSEGESGPDPEEVPIAG